jgi:ribosome biogenesis protein BRX1
MLDLFQLLPHAKKDAKLDTKKDRSVINDVVDAAGCSSAVFFEARKKADLYLWLSRPPDGPSVKFLVRNVHTMAELKLAGNHMRGSRPCLSFHGAFDDETKPHLALLKTMLLRTFATPRRHPKSKPFFDHVLSFTLADNKIWMRNYQVVPGGDKKGVLGGSSSKAAVDVETATATGGSGNGKVRAAVAGMSLVEVGPRACLEPIKIFAGSFGGRVLYDNAEYVSPNTVRNWRERERERERKREAGKERKRTRKQR